jgi:hypothetical protein
MSKAARKYRTCREFKALEGEKMKREQYRSSLALLSSSFPLTRGHRGCRCMRFVIDSHLFLVVAGLSGLDSLHPIPIGMIPSSLIASLACAQSLCTGHFMPTVMHMVEFFFFPTIISAVTVGTAVVAANALSLASAVVAVTTVTELMNPNNSQSTNSSPPFVFCGQLSLVDDQRVVKYQEDYSKKAFLTDSCLTTTIRSI